ncbi:uncharacterized protein LOC124944158 [Impatiens glandulifera]|uniref:uncharacterized protein LOC124944158 n=1 Tax=Impatiens glandulifera TaxID=253017 RepID=UPI001FB11F4B|nr:uncharacterized protein LOC124944158 [Impatiens glandulifera]
MHKLSPKFYGPFLVVEKIGKVAYRLNIPSTARMHNIIHVSQLKKRVGSVLATPHIPILCTNDTLKPVAILDERVVWKEGISMGQFLIRWSNSSDDDATWEEESWLMDHYPDLVLSVGKTASDSQLVRGRTRCNGEANVTKGIEN